MQWRPGGIFWRGRRQGAACVRREKFLWVWIYSGGAGQDCGIGGKQISAPETAAIWRHIGALCQRPPMPPPECGIPRRSAAAGVDVGADCRLRQSARLGGPSRGRGWSAGPPGVGLGKLSAIWRAWNWSSVGPVG